MTKEEAEEFRVIWHRTACELLGLPLEALLVTMAHSTEGVEITVDYPDGTMSEAEGNCICNIVDAFFVGVQKKLELS